MANDNPKGRNEMYIMEAAPDGRTTAHELLWQAQRELGSGEATVSHWRRDASNEWELLDRFSLKGSPSTLPSSCAPE